MKGVARLENFDPALLLLELKYRGGLSGAERDESLLRLSSGLAAFDSRSLYEFLFARQQVIYGVDDRQDLFEVTDPAVQRVANGVCAVLDSDLITPNGDGTSRIFTETYGVVNGLCPCEPFFDQPATDESRCCTGFLVAPNMILTAGHCVSRSSLERRLFVFGFRMRDAVSPQVFDIPDDQIYHGREVIAHDANTRGNDFALVVLDQVVNGHDRLPISREEQVEQDQPVYVVGHGMGLPLKFADGARVTVNTNASFFVANLDTYTGNSGSPVLNSDHVVEGIMVRGSRDFVPVGDCRKSLVCPVVRGRSDCAGEECVRVAQLAHLIPK